MSTLIDTLNNPNTKTLIVPGNQLGLDESYRLKFFQGKSPETGVTAITMSVLDESDKEYSFGVITHTIVDDNDVFCFTPGFPRLLFVDKYLLKDPRETPIVQLCQGKIYDSLGVEKIEALKKNGVLLLPSNKTIFFITAALLDVEYFGVYIATAGVKELFSHLLTYSKNQNFLRYGDLNSVEITSNGSEISVTLSMKLKVDGSGEPEIKKVIRIDVQNGRSVGKIAKGTVRNR